MLINCRILYVRVMIMAKRPRKNWPIMPVGVLYCVDGLKTVRNVFIKRSRFTVPPLPVILLWPQRALSENFFKHRAKLDEIAIDPSYTNEFELGAVRSLKLPDATADIAEALFNRLIGKHPRHRERKNLFHASYFLETLRRHARAKKRR